jgi:hypothetical protein
MKTRQRDGKKAMEVGAGRDRWTGVSASWFLVLAESGCSGLQLCRKSRYFEEGL